MHTLVVVLRASLRATLVGLIMAAATVSCDGDDEITAPGRTFNLADAQQILQLVPVAVAELVDVHTRIIQVARETPADGVAITNLGGNEYEVALEWDLDGDGTNGSLTGTASVMLDGDGAFESGTIILTDDADAGVSGTGEFFAERIAGTVDNPTYAVTADTFAIDARNAPQTNAFNATTITIREVQGIADLTYTDAPVLSGSFDFAMGNATGTVTLEPDNLGGWLIRLSGMFGSLPFEMTDDSPSRGAIEVTTSTTGAGTDANGYLVTVDGVTEAIGLDDVVTFFRLEDGNYDVQLTDIAANCTLGGNNPISVGVARGQTSNLTFSLECEAPTVGTWQVQSSGVDVNSSRLLGVSFVDANTGWAVGCCATGATFPAIVHTVDGSTWTQQDPGISVLLELRDVDFTDADTGTIVGNDGTILRTEDGGVTWFQQTINSTIDLFAVSFVDGQTGWALGFVTTFGGGAVIFSTADGGQTWAADTLLGSYLDDLFFLDANTGWAVGDDGTDPLVIRTTDGGQSWTPQSSIPTDDFPFAVHFVDAENGWAVGAKRFGGTSVIRTTDGGLTWIDQSQNLPATSGNQAMDVSFLDTMVGTMVLVGGHIYRTEDGGASWTEEVNQAENTTLNAVVTIDASTGVAVGDYWFGSQAAVIVRRQ